MIASVLLLLYAGCSGAMWYRLVRRIDVSTGHRGQLVVAYVGCVPLSLLWPVILVDWSLNRFISPRDSEVL